MRGRALSPIEELTETSTRPVVSTENTNSSSSSSMPEEMLTKMQLAVRSCQLGELETVRLLLLNGHVSADELDDEGCGLMHWAAINNKTDIIELLLSHDGNIDIIGGHMKSTPLHWACYNSQLAAVVLLVTCGADPSVKNVNGETPLHVAAQTGNSMLIAYLMVKFEYLKDVRDNLGRSALMLAAKASFGMFPTRIFVKCGVFLDFKDDENGETALHIMMARQNLSGACDLVCAGADVTIQNKAGQTPFDLVEQKTAKQIREHVATRRICEHGNYWEKFTSKWFLIQFFSAIGTAILLAAGIGLFFLTNFWVVLGALLLGIPLLIWFGRRWRMDQLALFPVTYICWMGSAELGLLIFDTDGYIHWSLLMVMCTIWVISASLYWLLILTDPGVLRRSTNPFHNFIRHVEKDDGPVDRFCFTCWIPKTSTSHHCSQCDKCVDGFDHHCPWIHKCVYRQNLRFFVLFCLTNFLFDLIYVPVVAYVIVAAMTKTGFNVTISEHGILLISLLFGILHVFGAAAITFTQISQISRHVTTIETIRNAHKTTATSGSSESEPTTNRDEWTTGRGGGRPSLRTRFRNVWNLLAFDRFGETDEPTESISESSKSTV